MCLYVFACVCMCLYVFVYDCMCSSVIVYACMCLYVFVYVCLGLYMFACGCLKNCGLSKQTSILINSSRGEKSVSVKDDKFQHLASKISMELNK